MRRKSRRGMALLGAMLLLALSSAVVVGTFSAARAMRRAAFTTRARVRVETGVRRAFGEVLAGWSVGLDSLAVGTGTDVALAAEPPEAGPPMMRRARVDHVMEGLYAVTVDLRTVTWEQPVAQRRARLWLERSSVGAPGRPALVTPWAFADLY